MRGISSGVIFLMALGMGTLGMFLCAHARRKRFLLRTSECALFIVLLTTVGVMGTKVLFAAENGFKAWNGVSFFGSVFLIPVLMPVVGKLFRQKAGMTMDICAPCVAIMIGCMRVGCFLTGCCGGRTACIGNLCFVWPTQAIESILDFAILGILLQWEEQKKLAGGLYPMFMLFYSAMRFFIEFLRDTPKDMLCLSYGQWYSLAAILVAGVWITALKRKGRQA